MQGTTLVELYVVETKLETSRHAAQFLLYAKKRENFSFFVQEYGEELVNSSDEEKDTSMMDDAFRVIFSILKRKRFIAWKTPERLIARNSTARILDGRVTAQAWLNEIASQTKKFRHDVGMSPGLAVIHVQHVKESLIYVQKKKDACKQCGIQDFSVTLPNSISQESLIKIIAEHSNDSRIHGILVQLPLPKHINEEMVLGSIPYEKDVDGFHPWNAGMLAMRGRMPRFIPCTPKGCVELLKRNGVSLKQRRVAIVGNSNIVGTPLSFVVRNEGAISITLCDSNAFHLSENTSSLKSVIRVADFVFVAIGKPESIEEDWIKPGAVVVDIGIKQMEDGRVVGDVHYENVSKVAGAITPVPGGVGPMTVAALMDNTLLAAMRLNSK